MERVSITAAAGNRAVVDARPSAVADVAGLIARLDLPADETAAALGLAAEPAPDDGSELRIVGMTSTGVHGSRARERDGYVRMVGLLHGKADEIATLVGDVVNPTVCTRGRRPTADELEQQFPEWVRAAACTGNRMVLRATPAGLAAALSLISVLDVVIETAGH